MIHLYSQSKWLVIIVLFSLLLGSSSDTRANSSALDQPHSTSANVNQAELVESPNGMYLIRLRDESIPNYLGGIDGLEATSPIATQQRKLDLNSPATVAYGSYLQAQQIDFIKTMEKSLGRQANVRYRYTFALNGLAVQLTYQEAISLADLPEVMTIEADSIQNYTTDVGPAWIGAPSIWDGSATGLATKGEGIIVGIMDTGINMDHPSFAEVGGDGYVHVNPNGSGKFLGWCDSGNPNYDPSLECNNKLIGAWDYADATQGETNGPRDYDGHGSHTASTTAGNIVTATMHAPTTAITSTISGVAPHANIIMYDVCGDQNDIGCADTDLVAAINQAIADNVDVLNESISIGGNAFTGSKQLAYLSAMNAGIFVARSAGNDGPGAGTVGPEPVWTTSVAAMTHNRALHNSLINMTGGNTTAPSDIAGEGFTAGYGSAKIVYAGDFPSGITGTPELCGAGDPLSFTSPWPAGTFNGEIVVCDRGTYGRVEKGANVLSAGAGGYILVDNGGGVVADAHELPGVHISMSDGNLLKTWLADGATNHMGTILGTTPNYDASNGDVVAGFSSRGPGTLDVIKPDVGAPGSSIWAAYTDNPGGADEGAEYAFLSGTSMSSPHVAGAGALLMSLYPSWSPTEIRSALMGTSVSSGLLKEDGASVTDAFDVGNGRIDVSAAAATGLLMDEIGTNFLAANPNIGGDPKTLNLSSLANTDCAGVCNWTRMVRNTMAISATWTVTQTTQGALSLNVTPAEFTLNPGQIQILTISADTIAMSLDTWDFGEIRLIGTAGGVVDILNLYLPIVQSDSSSGRISTADNPETNVSQAQLIPDFHFTVAVVAKEGSLYDQTGSAGSIIANSQEYGAANNTFTNQGADDFEIPAPDVSWSIDEVFVEGGYFNGLGPAPFVNVEFFNDNSGVPGTMAKGYDGLTSFLDVGGDLSIDLSADPAVLLSGTYWLSVQVDMNSGAGGQWGWLERTIQLGNPAMWQNPLDGFSTGCTSWMTASLCGLGTDPDYIFRLRGTINPP